LFVCFHFFSTTKVANIVISLDRTLWEILQRTIITCVNNRPETELRSHTNNITVLSKHTSQAMYLSYVMLSLALKCNTFAINTASNQTPFLFLLCLILRQCSNKVEYNYYNISLNVVIIDYIFSNMLGVICCSRFKVCWTCISYWSSITKISVVKLSQMSLFLLYMISTLNKIMFDSIFSVNDFICSIWFTAVWWACPHEDCLVDSTYSYASRY